MDFKKMALAVQDEVVAFRHDLHEHPESSLKEFRTTDQIAKEMDKLNIPYQRFDPTGLVATIKGGKPGDKTIMLRADIDALEIQEKTNLPFASKEPGKMHACGHDTHAAMLVGAAKVLSQIKDEIPGTVKLLPSSRAHWRMLMLHSVSTSFLCVTVVPFTSFPVQAMPLPTISRSPLPARQPTALSPRPASMPPFVQLLSL